LPQHLSSVNDQTMRDTKLVIVDNASTDTTRECIKKYAPHAQAHYLDSNIGLEPAWNRMIQEATTEYVCLVNQDTWLSPTYLEECCAWLDAHPDCSEVSGTLLRCESLQQRNDDAPLDSAGLTITSRYFIRNKQEGERQQPSSPAQCFGVSATAAVYRRAALEDVALEISGKKEYFDEAFFMYKEDVDISFRLRWRGWTAWNLPVIAYHVRTQRKGERNNSAINYLSYRNMLLTWYKNISGGLFLRNAVPFLMFEIGKILYALLRERELLRGFKDAVRLEGQLRIKRSAIQYSRICTDAEMMRFFTDTL